ncbi:hypothetical protein GCM10009795_015160 [Nocardioides hankookensis]|uniref:Glycosyltransferase RgtA/B/C/D-like domain-containing protein n=1 Tax=Nocardioides hankookensis TaxID=443157 RepID=A0ABW1LJD1_9ACTN
MTTLNTARPAPGRPTQATSAPGLDPRSRRRAAWATGLGLGSGAIVFYVLLLDFSTNLQRQANGLGFASNFFDIQAEALRHGHLWVPADQLGIEAFNVRGHSYMYYGIFPALLRMPVQVVTTDFDGKLSLISMGIAWIIFAVMLAKLFWLVRRSMGRPQELSRTEAVVAGLFLASITGGSVVAFDASLPWVYHEVYLWSMAAVVGSLYWILRVAREPSRSAIAWLFLFLAISALTRTTGGWATTIAAVGLAVWMLSGRLHPGRRRAALAVLAAALVPFLAAVTVNYIRFRHPFLFPLESQEWTQLNSHRREALEANGGSLVGFQFFPSSLANYFNPAGIRFTDYFPWISFPAEPAQGYGAVLDQSYRTGSVTAFMLFPLLLTLVSIPMLFRRLPSQEARAVRLIWVGALLVTAGVMLYGYVAYRYTSEFIPILVVGGCVGAQAVGGWAARWPRGGKVGVVGLALALTLFGAASNAATANYTTAITYRGAPLEHYVGHQVDLSGGTSGFARLVHADPGLPSGGSADDLWIRGDCDALYLNTGETSEPWVLVQERDTAVDIRIGSKPEPGRYPIMQSSADDGTTVSFEVIEDYLGGTQGRIDITNSGGSYAAQPFDLVPGTTVRVGARNLSEIGYSEISSEPGGFAGYLATTSWSDDWVMQHSFLELTPQSSDAEQAERGIVVTPATTLPLPLCQRVARAAGVDLPSD